MSLPVQKLRISLIQQHSAFFCCILFIIWGSLDYLYAYIEGQNNVPVIIINGFLKFFYLIVSVSFSEPVEKVSHARHVAFFSRIAKSSSCCEMKHWNQKVAIVTRMLRCFFPSNFFCLYPYLELGHWWKVRTAKIDLSNANKLRQYSHYRNEWYLAQGVFFCVIKISE